MNNNLKELIHYRIEKAVELMRAAEILFENGSFRASVNRSYYAMFYMVLALLTIESKETSKHSGAISLFDKILVKRGLFSVDLSRWLHYAFLKRMDADYNPIHSVSLEEASEILNHAQEFIIKVKDYLQKNF